MNLHDWPVAPWVEPVSDFDGWWAGIGVKQTGVPVSPDLYSELYYGLAWERNEDGSLWFGACVGMWVNQKRASETILNFLRPAGVAARFSLTRDHKTVWLWLHLSATETASFNQNLDDVLEAWIELWRRAGGFKGLSVSGATEAEAEEV